MPFGTNPVITTTYAGEFAGKYLAAALLSAPTLEQGGVTILPNVAYKQVMQKVATGDIVANATCNFTASGTVTLTERVLTTEEFQVNLELCKLDLAQSWQSASMGYSAFKTLPKTFADFLIAHVAAKVAAKIETTIWNGTNATAGEFAGFKTLMLADADVIDVTPVVSGAGMNATTVIGEIGKTVDAIPASLYGNEGLRIYVSQKIAKLYVRALGGFGASGLGANGTNTQGTQWYTNGSLSYDGIPIFMANGLGADNMVATTVDNLYFGCGLLNDSSLVKTLDMADIDGSNNVRVILRYNAGIQYGIGSDIVLYGV
jgi:uncharacterized protein YunC (DUF1805 family)